MHKLIRVAGLLSTGLVAGAFVYSVFTVVPTFYQVPREVHLTYRVALMRHNALYMQMIMALSIVSPACWAYTIRHSRVAKGCALSASLMALTSLLVTRFGNVPINRAMHTWSVAAPPADYLEQLHRWAVFHDIRTAAATMSFLFALGAEVVRN
jgi:Domain of unknown function (DUF1772)